MTEVEMDKWKSVIGFSQTNNIPLSQSLRCLQDYEYIDICLPLIEDIIVCEVLYLDIIDSLINN